MVRKSHAMIGCVSAMCALVLTGIGCANHPMTEAKHESSHATSAPAAHQPAVQLPTIRIDAGADKSITDPAGVVWAADSGFVGGDVQDRPDLQITGTSTPQLYYTERYGMDAYNFKVPNGDYVLKLHFSEDYDGVTSPDGRRFAYAVKDGPATGKTLKEVKHFSPWEAAGAQFKAYVDSIPVTVTTGELTVTFTPETENTQINALEIVPK